MGNCWSIALLTVLLGYVFAQNWTPCQNAPSFAAWKVCEQILSMGQMNETKPTVDVPLAPPLYGCLSMECVCKVFTSFSGQSSCWYKGREVKKVTRKEYRTMDDEERERFHKTLQMIKAQGTFDEIAKVHSGLGMAGGAHSGPAFLPWHREFIKRFELELRRIDPNVFLPYWDSTLDSRLPRPQDSALFTPELMGTSVGPVIEGPFVDWKVNGKTIERDVGARIGPNPADRSSPLTDANVNYLLQRGTANNFFSFAAGRASCPWRGSFEDIEQVHGMVHLWVGGDMFPPETSANDPIFYLHHAFVDYIWEMWRVWYQGREERENYYALPDLRCTFASHFYNAPLDRLRTQDDVWIFVRDGLSNNYTDELYEYASRPKCTVESPDCGSRFLFCDFSHGEPRCVAKARVGGSCEGFVKNEDACYKGVCQREWCYPEQPPTTEAPNPEIMPPGEMCHDDNKWCIPGPPDVDGKRCSEDSGPWCIPGSDVTCGTSVACQPGEHCCWGKCEKEEVNCSNDPEGSRSMWGTVASN